MTINPLDKRIYEIAGALHASAASDRPAIFEPSDWLHRAIERSLDDPGLRTALFRFVDVLPSLDDSTDVAAHLREYFDEADHALAGLLVLAEQLHAGWAVAPLVRRNVEQLAQRFLVDEDRDTLQATVEELRAQGVASTVDVVGEAVLTAAEADATLDRYRGVLANLAEAARNWTPDPRLDRPAAVSLSVKVSSLVPRFDPLDGAGEAAAAERLLELWRDATALGAALTVDMENHALKTTTLAIFRGVVEEGAPAGGAPLAIALQAYLRESAADVSELIDWARQGRHRIGVRLVKGAYWDSEIAWALQAGRPAPVFTDKGATDASFELLSRQLLEASDVVELAVGSHNLRSLAHAIAVAETIGCEAPEIQMLHGMAEPLRRALTAAGHRVRIYLPAGDLLPGMAYLIRRLLENTSNVSFLRQSYREGRDLGELLRRPVPTAETAAAPTPSGTSEALADFSLDTTRSAMRRALDHVDGGVGEAWTFHDGEEENWGTNRLVSRNPAAPEQVVGEVAAAHPADVAPTVERARRASAAWRRRSVGERAAVLRRAAAEMRARRFELAAWLVFEVGKGWRDADAEIAEAIDFLEYYAAEAMRLEQQPPRPSLPGEANQLRYEALGVVAVIAPWNFPIAILTGMTAAALVTGNAAILKPAEQSSVAGAILHGILFRAGVPPAVCPILPGNGDVGAALVRDPGIDGIAFTGSRKVGMEILAEAARDRPKRVVCEMGGKNAIVVDEDADPDSVILAVLGSAFGYQGQKCSACSRLILVGDARSKLPPRLVEAAGTLRVGPPIDPSNEVGPMIEAAAVERIAKATDRAAREGRVRLRLETPEIGWYAAPVIVDSLPAEHALCQDELFGPFLAILEAESFEEAIDVANATPYGLTGGVFSRSPAHLEYARESYRVGNLYLNRGITGAFVDRQPFGGLKLSGVGWKAGGPDYLRQFQVSRSISENTIRQGFAPEVL